jgi:hypothetical protein
MLVINSSDPFYDTEIFCLPCASINTYQQIAKNYN